MHPGFNLNYHLWLAFAWTIFCVLHSVLALPAVKDRATTIFGNWYRLIYSIFAAVSLGAVLYFQFTNAGAPVFAQTMFTSLTGAMIALTGAAGMAVCIRKYFMNLSGVDVLLKQERQAVLEVQGLHKLVRHPLYSSTLMFCWGLFLLLPESDNLLACSLITVYTLFGIQLEEKKLVQEYGVAYRNYASATPMLIPGKKIF